LPGSKVTSPRFDQPFVTGSIETTLTGPVPVVGAGLTWRDRRGGYKVRWGIGRYTYTVDPGLYAIGSPDDLSPVLVTANYKLTFDALRRTLVGRDTWILVLDTRGINVWCAAGKGTFGTQELVSRVKNTGLAQVVSHGVLVLPQLGATGVAAHEVRRATGFRVVWGPVRAADLPAFLDSGMRATPEMRTVTFPLRDRLVLMPVEAVNLLGLTLAVAAGAAAVGGIGPGVYSVARALERAPIAVAAAFGAIIAGTVVTPALLPWLPSRMFAEKGAAVGIAAALLIDLAFWSAHAPLSLAAAGLVAVVGSSFAAMNYTGTSTFTSLHGVEKEMRLVMPWQALGALLAAGLWIAGGWY
jgi:hypothetical protein